MGKVILVLLGLAFWLGALAGGCEQQTTPHGWSCKAALGAISCIRVVGP